MRKYKAEHQSYRRRQHAGDREMNVILVVRAHNKKWISGLSQKHKGISFAHIPNSELIWSLAAFKFLSVPPKT